MKYESQRIAYYYFVAATVVFFLQVIFGLVTAAKYVWDYDPLIGLLPFNTARAIHLNLLIFWLLMGFMGGAYYIVPEEAESELYSVRLANFQLLLFAAICAAAPIGYIFGWTWGMPFLEQPTILKAGIVIASLIFLVNILVTIVRGRKWTAIQGMLLFGLVTLAGLFLAGVFFMKNLSAQFYYWWWVIHLWAEVAWALIAGSMIAFVLMKLTGVEREAVEKWLYIELGLGLFTGIVSTGHHYYWIGTPSYWLWIGAVFSVISPLPILLMVIDTLRVVREKKIEVRNKVALYWAVGSAIMHFFGAGVWGFAHSLPQINQWTHGTQFTASHAHFAFYGAYVMLNLAVIYFAMPGIKGFETFNMRPGMRSFWIINFFMIMVVFSFTTAGIVQAYVQRIMGLDYFSAQRFMKLWFSVLWVSGWGLMAGVSLYLIDFFTLKPKNSPR